MPDFTHLHCHSAYSLKYGVAFAEELVAAAAEQGFTKLALTDRDGLYGAVRFAAACQAAGISPILGVDLPLVFDPVKPSSAAFGGNTVDFRPPRATFIARGPAGLAALNRLVSARHELDGVDADIVAQVMQVIAGEPGGLTVLLGSDSDLARAVLARRNQAALAVLAQWQQTGAEVMVEVVSHRARDPQRALTAVNGRTNHGFPLSTPAAARLWRFAEETGTDAVLTNAVRHLTATQAKLLDVLDSSRRLVPISGREVDRSNGEGYLKSADQMQAVAREIAQQAGFGEREVAALFGATCDLADRAVIDPQLDLGMGSVHVPELDVILGERLPASEATWHRPLARRRSARLVAAEAARADVVLRESCQSQLHQRFPPDRREAAQQRLDEELAVIAQLGFASFFLTVKEVVQLTRERDIRVAARGSGAGSLVNYLLGISALNPLDHGLLMERFLSPLRTSLPDIDIDVESHRRLEVYDAIIERFGADRVACVSMMETYRVRHAIRDVGRALALPPAEIDAMAKAFPHIRARDARKAVEQLPELRRSGLGQLASGGKLDALFELVEGLDGLPRQAALHPCGVLLSDSSLLDRTPVQASAGGFPMSQYDKDDVETLGFLKLDVLGIRMQSAMSHAVAEIARVEGGTVVLDELPLVDEETFELIASTKTLGCFQIESPGQRELVGKFAPASFNDIIIDISLFRPGPVKSDMITPFLQARQGWKPAEYLHPDLRPVLAETAGVVVFHEQVISVLSILTGCSLAEADEVRRAMGNWDKQTELRAWFFTEALRRDYELEVVEEVWEVLRAFASFGFCKAHAGAFALPTYQSAWLKAHHPAAFYAGVLTHDPGMYPRRLILDDARQFGVPILPLEANRSGACYLVEPESATGDLGIRIPFSQVKGISADEVDSLVAAQPFSSIADAWRRTAVTRPTMERLVLAGGFDSLHGVVGERSRRGALTRRDLFVHVADLERTGRRTTTADELLFADSQPADPLPTGLPDLTAQERVSLELEILEMDVSEHVLSAYEPMLSALSVVRSRELLNCRSRSEVWVAGVKVATQTPPVRSGKRVVFLTLDDATGPVDCAFFEDAQTPYASTLFSSWLLLVRGELRRTGPKGVSIRATGCWDLTALSRSFDAAGGGSRGANAVWQSIEDSESEWLPDVEFDTESAEPADNRRRRAGGMGGGRSRVLLHPSGFKMSPWADIVPTSPAKKLWHASPGSPG